VLEQNVSSDRCAERKATAVASEASLRIEPEVRVRFGIPGLPECACQKPIVMSPLLRIAKDGIGTTPA